MNAVGKEIFDFEKRSFVKDLGVLIKREVIKSENENSAFKSILLRTILTDLYQTTEQITHANRENEDIFNAFKLYV